MREWWYLWNRIVKAVLLSLAGFFIGTYQLALFVTTGASDLHPAISILVLVMSSVVFLLACVAIGFRIINGRTLR